VSFERVKQFKDLMVDYDAPAGGTVQVWTDMPGTTMALRLTYNLPATTGRQTKNVPMDGIEGTLIRFVWAPSVGNVMRLYAATLRLRPIGVYLDGSNGEIWKTQEMGFGI
jgi:hypothetical protein